MRVSQPYAANLTAFRSANQIRERSNRLQKKQKKIHHIVQATFESNSVNKQSFIHIML